MLTSFTPSSVAAALLWVVDGSTKQGVQRHASFERAGPGVSDLDPSDDHLPWDGRVFADIVNQMVSFVVLIAINPLLNWSEVVMRLDDDSFRVGSRAALRVLTDTLIEGLQGRPFPVSLLYRKWNHQCCVDLVETLLTMASADPRLNSAVLRAVHPAMTICPDVLLLALFQIPVNFPPITSIRQHIFQVLIPAIIIQHPNAVSVLNIGWNTDVLPRKVVHNSILSAFVSLYMKPPEDQQKLARILDIAHELKPGGLAELFSSSQLQFIVDLGCLASKRDYLKLEKWLEDKLQEHGQPLIKTVLCHMERRLPSTGSANSLPVETFSVLLAFVRNHLPMVAPAIRQQYTALTEQLKDMQRILSCWILVDQLFCMDLPWQLISVKEHLIDIILRIIFLAIAVGFPYRRQYSSL
uniref:CNOT1_HEAT domain-containing protein n=1 Tax=Heterorhabditis bacteriophora TaxID=37862 RepID=A0A1I7X8V9_HETBA